MAAREMTFAQRFLLTLFIVLVFLLVIAAFGYFSGGWEDDPDAPMVRFGLASALAQPIKCVPDEETREKVRSIMLDAMDQALREHIVHLHETWMKDDTGQPARAVNGAQRGMRAYLGGRATALKWTPPLCQ